MTSHEIATNKNPTALIPSPSGAVFLNPFLRRLIHLGNRIIGVSEKRMYSMNGNCSAWEFQIFSMSLSSLSLAHFI
ncbi:hypothetical protein P8452_46930 [Trifolium repens]|nr:hypothetical protein P8452_46930 [Trifolium repens]